MSKNNIDIQNFYSLPNIGISYFSHLDFEQALYGKNLQVVDIKQPSEALVSADVIPTYLLGTVSKVDESGVSIDVKRDIDIPLPIDGNTGRSIDYMNVSGLGSSSWESSILGGFFSMPTVSAVKLLNAAYKQGIPIYTITSSNMDSILPKLSVDSTVISAIQDAINAGDEVIISQSNIQYYDWNGVGYIVYDPATGAGGYMISGGLMGVGTACPLPKPGASDPPGQVCPATVPLTSLFAVDSYGETQLTAEARENIIMNAASALGSSYVPSCPFGGETCTNHCPAGQICFDCSGLVSAVYAFQGFTQYYKLTNGLAPSVAGGGATKIYAFLVGCGAMESINTLPQNGDIYFFKKNKTGINNNPVPMDHVAIAVGTYGALIDAVVPTHMVSWRTIDDVISKSGYTVTFYGIGNLLDNSNQCLLK